jgi:hypothetical protein
MNSGRQKSAKPFLGGGLVSRSLGEVVPHKVSNEAILLEAILLEANLMEALVSETRLTRGLVSANQGLGVIH